MRYLMIDRILEYTSGSSLVAVKNVTRESDVLEHHFPGFPLFPGALTLEAMAQASGALIMRSSWEQERRPVFCFLTSAESRFMRGVFPGDQLRLDVEIERREVHLVKTRVQAAVLGKAVARSRLGMVVADPRTDEEQTYASRILKAFDSLMHPENPFNVQP